MMLFVKIIIFLKGSEMESFFDTLMTILFVLFMIFVFGGYHKNKSAEREAAFKREEQKKEEALKKAAEKE